MYTKILKTNIIFYILATGILFSVALYMYYINLAVRNVVARNNAEVQISDLEATLSDLETQYVKGASSITLESAATFGLTEPHSKIFISLNQ